MGRTWHPNRRSRKKVDEKRFARLIKGRQENAKIEVARATENIPPKYSQRYHLQALIEEAILKTGKKGISCKPEDLTNLSSAKTVQKDQHKKCKENSKIIIEHFDIEVMRQLKNNPTDLRQMTGHAFEDLLAEVLTSLGFEDISLRVQTIAGEVDILGFSEDRMGIRIGYIFELKQFGVSGRPVTLDAITRLNGLRDGLRNKLGISQGVFVTTTHYTKPAREAASFHQITLKQFEHLVEWLEQYELAPNGLFFQSEAEES